MLAEIQVAVWVRVYKPTRSLGLNIWGKYKEEWMVNRWIHESLG